VLSTLHTNDAPSAVTRLVEMGLPAYVVASSLVAVLAQRLVRRLCDCRTTRPDGSAVPRGCDACRFSGFKGRMAVYEVMRLSPRVRSVILARASDDVVRRAARAGGMMSMFEDGQRKAAGGVTVIEEVRRVVPPDEEVVEDEQAEAGAPAVPAALAPEARSARASRVLVVEDDPAMAAVLRDILAEEQYSVALAANGDEALSMVYKERPDLVLTDLQMPGMDGLELLRKLRRDLSTCQIPVVFLTVVDAIDSEAQALDLGADDYITKPVQRGRLLGRIRRSLLRAQLMK
jgi:CheY-like chemotaxis protein